ncbi:MAG: hydrogen gas-evolving membrane-bound hydrogenase subunit E [Candidatus Bipolaricaulota bacterium]
MRKALFMVVFLVVVAFFFSVALEMRPFAEPNISDMGHYLLEEAQQQSSTNNIVTAVVFDYRGFDTLGEATVLFTAVLGVAVLFRRLKA